MHVPSRHRGLDREAPNRAGGQRVTDTIVSASMRCFCTSPAVRTIRRRCTHACYALSFFWFSFRDSRRGLLAVRVVFVFSFILYFRSPFPPCVLFLVPCFFVLLFVSPSWFGGVVWVGGGVRNVEVSLGWGWVRVFVPFFLVPLSLKWCGPRAQGPR